MAAVRQRDRGRMDADIDARNVRRIEAGLAPKREAGVDHGVQHDAARPRLVVVGKHLVAPAELVETAHPALPVSANSARNPFGFSMKFAPQVKPACASNPARRPHCAAWPGTIALVIAACIARLPAACPDAIPIAHTTPLAGRLSARATAAAAPTPPVRPVRYQPTLHFAGATASALLSRLSISKPSRSAIWKSRPDIGRVSASASSAVATGPVGCRMVSAWVSSKPCTLELVQLSSDAVSMSVRWRRPITVACAAPATGNSALSAIAMLSCCEPPIAQPSQFRNERLTSWRTLPSISSQRVASTKSASPAAIEALGAAVGSDGMGHSAVEHDGRALQVGALLTHQEFDDVGHVLRHTQPAQAQGLGESLLDLIARDALLARHLVEQAIERAGLRDSPQRCS